MVLFLDITVLNLEQYKRYYYTHTPYKIKLRTTIG